MTDQENLPSELKSAMALPQGRYIDPKSHHQPSGMLVGMGHKAVTNAISTKPIIGTAGFGDCLAIVMYNRDKKKAGVYHIEYPDSRMDELLAQVRDTPEDHVDIHIIGSAKHHACYGEGAEGMNRNILNILRWIPRQIDTYPNVTLRTFDVYDKPQPHAVAIDARNGRLIRGSDFFTTSEASTVDLEHSGGVDFFDAWDVTKENFDGTSPEFQRQVGGRIAPKGKGKTGGRG